MKQVFLATMAVILVIAIFRIVYYIATTAS